MSISELIHQVEQIPPGSSVPRDWILEQLEGCSDEPRGVTSWVDIKRAAQILDGVPGYSEEELRRKAVRWRGMPNPPIRVTKNNPDLERSPWRFAEEDCWRIHGETTGPQLVEDTAGLELDQFEGEDRDTVAYWVGRAIGEG